LRKFRRHLPFYFLGWLLLAGASAPARAADATASPATAAPGATVPSTPALPTGSPQGPHKPILPLDFANFAADYQPVAMRQEWLQVEVGEMESIYKPPLDMTDFSLPAAQWRPENAVDFKPVELTCVMGAKTRSDNVMVLDADKSGHPLGYALPLGQIIYFLARAETPDGIYFTVHYYDSTEVHWVANPDSPGTYLPVTQPTMVTKDAIARADAYSCFLLSERLAPSRPDVPIPPVTLYKYLVVHIHPVEEAPMAEPSGLVVPPGGPAVSPGS
jgi:hypothetical protein